MPSALTVSYEDLKARTKTPIWMFSGLVLIALAITIGVIADRNKDERNAKLILVPKTGDTFEIKTKDSQYTLYKIDQVEGDSVFIRANIYETSKASGIDDLKEKGDSAYSEEIYSLSKAELKQMLDKGEILDIDRK